ncbi:probable RNA-directed DNA polymerase from transposon X-element [Trichonephila clavipes]|nr:probable RNA-directed DNA polymerase from transposon X-element [Trichonephila clavipes]
MGVWTESQSSIPYLDSCDVGLGESGVLHSALWHGGDWMDGIREAWLTREIAKDIQAYSRVQWEKRTLRLYRPLTTPFGGNPLYYEKPFQSIPPLKGALGSIAITPIEKAEVIADSLQVQFEPNHVAGRELFDQRIHDEVTNFINTPFKKLNRPLQRKSYLCTETQAQEIPGLDQISNPVRFRPPCSTVHQLLRVTELIHSGFAKHEATGILFLDIAKAFDKIWHDGLLIKLIRLDFPPLIKSIHSFLSDRSFRVRVDKTLSSPRPIRSGLPQGSLSSPLLFTLYVNDMPQTDLSHLAMFADDTAIITQNKRFSVVISNLQHYVSLLELWLTDWKIKVNASKSACLMFTRRPRLPVGLTPVQIFGQPVPWVHVAKYLGLFLDAKLTFAHHIEQTRKKRRLFMPFSNGLSPEGVNLRSGIRFCSINL